MHRPFPYLTADDWGMSPAINEGILELAKLGGIARVSILSSHVYANHQLSALKAIGDIKTGLHFDLTHHSKFQSPYKLFRTWLSASKKTKNELKYWVRAELSKQIEAMKKLETPTQYFDGHQHIQLIPGLFEEISDLLHAHGIKEVRVPLDWRLLRTPKLPISLLAFRLKKVIQKHGFHSLNFCYPKFSDFKNPERLRKLFLKNAKKEILVHPATRDDLTELGIPDNYREARVTEYVALKKMLQVFSEKVDSSSTTSRID